MAIDLDRIPSTYLQDYHPEVGDSFKAMRQAIAKGPLDYETCEYIVIASFAQAGFEEPLKIHVTRMLNRGTPVANLKHAVEVTLGATTPLFAVVRALRWIDEAVAEHGTP